MLHQHNKKWLHLLDNHLHPVNQLLRLPHPFVKKLLLLLLLSPNLFPLKLLLLLMREISLLPGPSMMRTKM